MGNFREENRFFIYSACFCGLYMHSIDRLTTKKWLIAFLTVWTKLPILILTLVLVLDSRAAILEKDPVKKSGIIRKVIGDFRFLMKNIVFYWERRRIEELMDLWDASFREDLYRDKYLINRENNRQEIKKLVKVWLTLGLSVAFVYSVPSYFSKTKEIKHPTGLIYPHRSPEFEIAVTFDVIATTICMSSVFFDCFILVFLSVVRSQLFFLRNTLGDIIHEIAVDDQGRLFGRRADPQVAASPKVYYPKELTCASHQRVYPYETSSHPRQDQYEERLSKDREYKRNLENIDTKLRIWVFHHQQTIVFFQEISRVFSVIATYELGHNVLYTALTAVNAVQMKLSLVALSTFFIASGNLFTLFLWCKLSGELKVDVFGEGFNRAWFLLPKKMKKSFWFIIMRSNKPLSLHGFTIYALNLALFSHILKLAYQFFTFMLQISNDDDRKR